MKMEIHKMVGNFPPLWPIDIFLVIGLVASHFLSNNFGFALTICSLLVVLLMSLICFFFYLSQKLQHD